MTQTDRDTPVTALLREALPQILAEADDAGSDADDWRGSEYVDDLATRIAAALASSDDVAGSGERLDDWDYVPRDMPLHDCIFECCITPVDTDHDAHVLRHLRRNGWDVTRIEVATAARSDEIDVETLARAYRNLQRPGARDDVEIAPGWLQDAHTIAAEYARLRSEQGERTPRVDSEIDAT